MKQKNVILMAVAVGCGLVAAFLTQYARSKPVEQVEVIVAAKDLPIGTVFSAAELNNLVVRKSVPKDGLPPKFITNIDELMDKRLGRAMRAQEALNPDDLNKGMSLPEGRDLVALPISAGSAAGGFVPPGSRIDITASVRLNNHTKVFKLLCNTLVVNANQDTTNNQKTGAYADLNQVGLALTEKEALALALAQIRGSTLRITLRNDKKSHEDDKDYDIEKVLKLLEDGPTTVVTPQNNPEVKPEVVKPQPELVKPEVVKPEPVKTVKVWVALEKIDPQTEITADLLKTKFEQKDLEESRAGEAVTDFGNTTDQAFVLGVAKGAHVVKSMIGEKVGKAPPREPFQPVVPPDAPPAPKAETAPAPKAVTPPAPPKREFVDVPVTTASGTTIHRYEKSPNGKIRKIGELTPEQAAATDKQDAPQAAPDARKLD